tara:strand:+ start:40670 stop:40981 length:312 start_codon:yes stop_codon:yes gene_type:complete
MTESCWFLYLIRCRNGTLYAGISTDVARRFAEHQAGAPKGARYLRGKGPLLLEFQAVAGNRSSATKLELWVKNLSRTVKEDVVAGRLDLHELFAAAQAREELQ